MMQTTDHEHNEAITLAAEWIQAGRPGASKPTIVELKQRYGLNARQAIEAIRQADRQRGRSVYAS